MAFHFNWSPLIADTDRVRQMLTTSLNKSPKPPIIVDDITVNELNLGSTPPSLEILEVGDLAEDRFRGIFKVRYEGDAYLTLKTRVQANPLNTFLSTKPSFASPCPLAAASSLTIPLQITLSDIRLSGFVILVFNRQKGITLVFRNDPLESLKVSSTFDSIPFVREYLQRTIEEQLRVLFMEDLPAIIHRLSLRAFNSEYQDPNSEEQANITKPQKESGPLADETQTAFGIDGLPVQSPSFDDDPEEMYASFSQKNLLRLAALSDSQRTLSLFTPSIPDAVYRASASSIGRAFVSEDTDSATHVPPTLSRIQSTLNMSNATTRSSATSVASSYIPAPSVRPSISSLASVSSTTYSLGSGSTRSHATRKRKHRIVNLRRHSKDGDNADTLSQSTGYDESASRSESVSGDGSTNPISPEMSTMPSSVPPTSVHPQEREGEVHTPEISPVKKGKRPVIHRASTLPYDADIGAELSGTATLRARPITPRHQTISAPQGEDPDETPRQSMYLPQPERRGSQARVVAVAERPKEPKLVRSASELSISDLVSAFSNQGGSSGGILEQAWMTKIATEVAKRVAEEKSQQSQQWADNAVNSGKAAP